MGIRSHLRVREASKLVHSLGADQPHPYCTYVYSVAPRCEAAWGKEVAVVISVNTFVPAAAGLIR